METDIQYLNDENARLTSFIEEMQFKKKPMRQLSSKKIGSQQLKK